MLQKYVEPSSFASVPRIITSDLYCAASLLSLGCSLAKVMLNERRRVAFVFTGERVREIRQAYKTAETLLVDARSFRDNLFTLKRLLSRKQEERNALCPNLQESNPVAPSLLNSPVAASPMQLSRA